MSRSRRRSMYCTPAERAEIAERAHEAGMSISGFLIACALADDGDDTPDTLLALTEEEQRTQYARIESFERWSRAMCERLPGIGVSTFDALAFLIRAAEARAGAGRIGTPEGRR